MRIFFLIFLLINSISCSQTFESTYTGQFEPTHTGQLVRHSYFSLSYNEEHEQAEWVCYNLNSEMINGKYERKDNFKADNKITTGSAKKSDYYNYDYDRGHLAPAADMKISKKAMSESFLFSNISPQHKSFNRGGWLKLEKQVRKWVLSEGEMYVVTGPVLTDPIQSIGSNNVTVPRDFYKIIYSKSKNKMIGFIMPNQKINNPLKYYVKSVDFIEDITGIDFFYQLEDENEEALESETNINNWNFTIVSKPSNSSKKSTSKQCYGIAKSTSNRCKNMTKNDNGYCYAHQSQSSDYNPPPTELLSNQ